MTKKTTLSSKRQLYEPILPEIFKDLTTICLKKEKPLETSSLHPDLQKSFPNTIGAPILQVHRSEVKPITPIRVGVVFSGGQAPGGHNVISGLFDALKKLNPNNTLLGFLDGPLGIVENNSVVITPEMLAPYRNMGGFDLIGSGRTKIETKEQLESAKKTAQELNLNGIVVIGGDDSNTNAAIMAEYFLENGCTTKVVGVPKTIDGDLQNKYIEISFGFDTACKVYSELIGNIAKDALSAKKYYHFIKLMGRSASHIALECSLSTHPNVVVIAEEVAKQKKTLLAIASEIADVVCKRAQNNKNFGIVLIPEGLIEFVPEMQVLIKELNHLLAKGSFHEGKIEKLTFDEKVSYIFSLLTSEAKNTFSFLPAKIQEQLLLDRDPHGNVKVSQIETERLFLDLVNRELSSRAKKGTYQGKFNALHHFFGYEGRAAMPSNFDAEYCYALGHLAALAINEGATGYICCIQNLKNAPVEKWQAAAIPITMMMDFEQREGRQKPVIKKALVDLEGKAFSYFKSKEEHWQFEDDYQFPGPIQYFGPKDITAKRPKTFDY